MKYANSESSSVARRIALVTSHYHLWHNPLVLRSSMLRQPRYKNMLEMRLKGGRQSSDPTRLKCGLALLIDELLERVVKDGPV